MVTLTVSIPGLVVALVATLIFMTWAYSDCGADWSFGLLVTVTTILIAVISYSLADGFIDLGVAIVHKYRAL
jgi:hypothetical protein